MGVCRYQDNDLEWFRLLSLSVRPKHTVPAQFAGAAGPAQAHRGRAGQGPARRRDRGAPVRGAGSPAGHEVRRLHRACPRGWKPDRSSASAPGASPGGFLEDISLVDGPVLWIAWAAGAAGLAYLLWRDAAGAIGRRARPPCVCRRAAVPARRGPRGGRPLAADLRLFGLPRGAALGDPRLVRSGRRGPAPVVLRLHGIWGRFRKHPAPPRPADRGATAQPPAAFLGVARAFRRADQHLLRPEPDGQRPDRDGRGPDPAARGRPDARGRAAPAAAGLARLARLPPTFPTACSAGPRSPARSPASKAGTPTSTFRRPTWVPPARAAGAGAVFRPAGGPADWLTGGALRSRLDRFAAAHGGVAPVTVVVDPNGSASANTLCMDSRIAQADTFLARDVPAWINQTLDVDPDPPALGRREGSPSAPPAPCRW